MYPIAMISAMTRPTITAHPIPYPTNSSMGRYLPSCETSRSQMTA
jgi:hypothetical protein